MASLQQSFGARIRQLRKDRGWSQEHFGDICEINRTHMGEIERGEVDVALTTLAKLAKGLDLSGGVLLKGLI